MALFKKSLFNFSITPIKYFFIKIYKNSKNIDIKKYKTL